MNQWNEQKLNLLCISGHSLQLYLYLSWSWAVFFCTYFFLHRSHWYYRCCFPFNYFIWNGVYRQCNRLQIKNILISLYINILAMWWWWRWWWSLWRVQFCKRKYRIETELINSEQIFHSIRTGRKRQNIKGRIHTQAPAPTLTKLSKILLHLKENRAIFFCNFFSGMKTS